MLRQWSYLDVGAPENEVFLYNIKNSWQLKFKFNDID